MTTTHDPEDESVGVDGSGVVDVVRAVETVVHAGPDRLAVVDTDGSTHSYRQLWDAAGDLADRLVLDEGEIVGICLPRGAAVVVAMLAVLRAGGVYCPLSPDDPPARTESLQRRVGMRFVLADGASGTTEIIDLGGRGRVLDVTTTHDRPVYVMWTSGSTGEPKAVVIPHRGVLRLMRDRTFMDLGPGDRVAFASNTMFDATTWEVWASLGNGATIVVVDQPDLLDTGRLRAFLDRSGVTRAFLSTSLFDMHVVRDPSMFGGLHSLAIGGEALRPHTIGVALASATPPGEILNGYGPTECTTFAVTHRVDGADVERPRIPIGRAFHATELAIVGDDGDVVEPGAEGELWLAGEGVALGYLGPDGLEHERFVETALGDDVRRRWYRTGDLVRTGADGSLDCLGRIDRQVKVRGFRVEPAEVERVLSRCPGVVEAAVVPEPTNVSMRLSAFVVLEAQSADLTAVRAHLRSELPGFMVPTRIVVVDALPVTPNGKLDTASLLARTSVPVDPADDVDLFDPQVAAVLDLVRTILDDPRIGPDDDLWDSGLDSLAVIELVDLLSPIVGSDLRPIDFVEHPSVAELVALADGSDHRRSTEVTVFNSGATGDPLFMVLGSGTSPLGLRHVAGLLAMQDRSLVVIEPDGLRSPHRADRRIEALADRVVREVRRRQPQGPLVLAGWSAGGAIATHATSVLKREGRDVHLALFDTLFFTPRDRRVTGSFSVEVLRHLVRRVRSGFAVSWARVRHSIGATNPTTDHPAEIDRHEMLADQARMFWIQLSVLRDYGPPPPIHSQVAHFHVRNSLAAPVLTSLIPDVDTIEVAGDHNSMFDAPNAPALVAAVEDWLTRTGHEQVRND